MSWREEMRTAIKTPDIFSNFEVSQQYPVFIPESYLKHLQKLGEDSPVWKQFVPSSLEDDIAIQMAGKYDPIDDKEMLVAPQLIHRYKTRALFLPTKVCPINCRYCFRKNEISQKDDIFGSNLDQTVAYLKAHPEINELIFTGGDPLILGNEKIQNYLNLFKDVESLKFIRFHTRVPVILPDRLSDTFYQLLYNFEDRFKFTFMIHANHKDEFTGASRFAIEKLAARYQTFSQTVLLKAVNNSLEALKDLMLEFIEMGVTPYYLHHPDKVKGGMHFYLSTQEGYEIYAQLSTELSGWMLPKYVVDTGKTGKKPVSRTQTFN